MLRNEPFIQKYFKKLTSWTAIYLVLFIGALLFFVYIMHEVFWEKEEEIDNAFFQLLSGAVTGKRTDVMEIITYGASSRFLQIGYALVVMIYLLQKNWKRAVEIAVVGVGGFLINYFMKLSFQRQRPPNPLIEPLHNFSFPSGHATSGFIFYGLLVYLIWKMKISSVYKYVLSSVLIFMALLIGFSRIYLRLHYLSDVVAGFCIGLAWLCLAVWIMEKTKKKTKDETHEMVRKTKN